MGTCGQTGPADLAGTGGRRVILAGLDPGLQGAFAFIDGDGAVIGIGDLPTHIVGKANGKLRIELDLHGFCNVLRECKPDQVTIEQVGPMPKQGISSTARFTYACGAVYGAVVAMGIPVSFVTPQRWQQHHRIRKGPDDAVHKVLQLYPALHESLKRKKDHHRADAVLIALHGLATLKGRTENVETARPGA
jgi:crossover junction endodeoxyribonuclease RuvC